MSEEHSEESKKIKDFLKIEDSQPVEVDEDGLKIVYWRLHDGTLHRKYGPAVICDDGTEEWYLDGTRHRDDGPAVTFSDGSQAWYQYGRRHRLDGPAVEWIGGLKEYYVNGYRLSLEDFEAKSSDLIKTALSNPELLDLIYKKK